MRNIVYILPFFGSLVHSFTPYLPPGRTDSGLVVKGIRESFILFSSAGSEATAEVESEKVGNNVAIQSQNKRVALVVCPAQFCVPADYDLLFGNLNQVSRNLDVHIAQSSRVVPLSRTDWIKVAKKLPTVEFLEARLPVKSTLDWYFQAIEDALAEIFAEDGEDVNICFVGHSIGGWVARAYLGGLSQSSSAVHKLAIDRCSSLITLGTPHISPADALVDQTRGLLAAIEQSESCSPQSLLDKGIKITCVSSQGLKGNFLTANVEEIVAASSYLPLLGRFDGVRGDGIVPTDLAFLDPPAERVILETCSLTNKPIRHAHVIPTPWNLLRGYAPSIMLKEDDFPSYVTRGVVEQWARYIQ